MDYRSLVTSSTYAFLQEALVKLAFSVSDHSQGTWVVYGSFATEQYKDGSDIDLLYLHHDDTPPTRIKAEYRSYPVTIYSLSQKTFEQDGIERRSGGFFTAKLLNPHIIFSRSEKVHNLIHKTVGSFIGSFAIARITPMAAQPITSQQINAAIVNAYIKICPPYQYYFLRYFGSPTFETLWELMTNVNSKALQLAGFVTTDGHEDQPRWNSMVQDDTLTWMEFIQCVARFWSMAACLHDSSPSFPDYYQEKAISGSRDNLERLSEMLDFLEQTEKDNAGRN